MISEDLEFAYRILYQQLANKPYAPAAYHTNSRDFVPDPILTDPKFMLDEDLVQPPGIEPGSTALQTAAMTTSAKVADK